MSNEVYWMNEPKKEPEETIPAAVYSRILREVAEIDSPGVTDRNASIIAQTCKVTSHKSEGAPSDEYQYWRDLLGNGE